MKAEMSDHYFKVWVLIVAVILLSLMWIFVLKPNADYQKKVVDFDNEKDVFMSNFCRNMGYENYAEIELDKYNAYCFTERGMARTVTYFTYDYEEVDGKYNFFALQEKR